MTGTVIWRTDLRVRHRRRCSGRRRARRRCPRTPSRGDRGRRRRDPRLQPRHRRRRREQAAAVDAGVAAGRDMGRLAGVPIALKDNMCTQGIPTTCSSRILDGWKPPYDATIVGRLREAGAVLIGKTNLDEFAMGSSTENSAFGPTAQPARHHTRPRRVERRIGGRGSSRVRTGRLGSDTGGSIRQPAALCGVVGVKPTYGAVSRYGLVAFASSLDQIGPFANTVADAALVLEVISGHDPMDSTSIAQGAPRRVEWSRPGRRGSARRTDHRSAGGRQCRRVGVSRRRSTRSPGPAPRSSTSPCRPTRTRSRRTT